jgi:hypothetical protein
MVNLDHQVTLETLDPVVLMEQLDQSDHLVREELQEMLVLQAIMVPQDQLGSLVMLELWAIQVILEELDSPGLLGLLVSQDLEDQMGTLELLDRLEIKDQLVHQDKEEVRVNLGQRVNQGLPVILDLREPPEMLGHKVHRDLEEMQDLKDLLVSQELKDLKEVEVSLDLVAIREPVDQLDQMDRMVTQVLKDLPVQMDSPDKEGLPDKTERLVRLGSRVTLARQVHQGSKVLKDSEAL